MTNKATKNKEKLIQKYSGLFKIVKPIIKVIITKAILKPINNISLLKKEWCSCSLWTSNSLISISSSSTSLIISLISSIDNSSSV